jgi:hypothetical protein
VTVPSAARALAALWLAAAATPASAQKLAFACSILSVIDISDVQPYKFTVLVDAERGAILDVDGDNGEGWVTQVFTEARIEARFDLPSRLGGLVLDRTTGTFDMIVGFRTPRPEIGQWHGTCEPPEKRP